MNSASSAFVVYRGATDRKGLQHLTGCVDSTRALEAVGRQITRNPNWKQSGGSVLVLRPGSEPVLTAFGEVHDAGRRDLLRLKSQLVLADSFGRYVVYGQAEIDSARLAAELLKKYSRDELLEFSYTAIPRGGLFVLGMVSYLLGLPRDRIHNPRNRSHTMVVVDDCSLSGLRFKEFLNEIDNPKVVFCPLYSHPDLRARICEKEARVDAVISAIDLIDRAPELYGASYQSWREDWENRTGMDAYWIGQPDYIAFPWGAPEVAFPDDEGTSREPGWSFIPESRSLKSRFLENCISDPPAFQVQMEGPGPIRCAMDVVFADLGPEKIMLARSSYSTYSGEKEDTGATYMLENSASVMFRALVECGAIESAADLVSEYYEADPDTVRTDLVSFLGELTEQGLLEDA